MKLFKKLKKPKVSEKDLGKIKTTIEENKKCLYCSHLIQENKECMEKHGIKNNLKSVTWHNLKCKDCRERIMLIAKCKKKRHNA